MSNAANARIRTRESNFELLRIVCMFMIVWNHFFTHGPWQDAGINSYLAHIFSFGKAGVDIFVMISGWFLVNSKFKSKSALKVLGQGLLYGTIFGIAATIKGGVCTLIILYCTTLFAHTSFSISSPLFSTRLPTASQEVSIVLC